MTKLRVSITIAVAVAALPMLVGFLWIMYLGTEEFICFDRFPWWGPPEDPNSSCSGLWWARDHPGEFPWTMPK